jgi:uncharacterized membrane protein
VLVLLIVYDLYFHPLKYAIFVLPMIIMAFNYRVAIEYFLYWTILCFSTIPFLMDDRIKTNLPAKDAQAHKTSATVPHIKWLIGRKIVVVVVVILFCLIPVSAVFYHNNGESRIVIESSVPQPLSNNRSFADSMNVTIYFSSQTVKSTDIFFRIIEPGTIVNGNGLIWNISDSNNTIKSDTDSTFILHTHITAEYLDLNESYRIVVYCSGMVSARTFS